MTPDKLSAIIDIVASIFMLIVSFGIIKLKYNSDERQIKFNKFLQKRKTFIRFFSVYFLIKGIIGLSSPNINEQIQKNQIVIERNWTDTDEMQLKEIMKKGMKEFAIQYPEVSERYCNCCTKAIMANLTYSQYVILDKKNSDEQRKVVFPLIYYCLERFNNDKDSIEKINKFKKDSVENENAKFNALKTL